MCWMWEIRKRVIKDGFYIFGLSKWVYTGTIYCDEEDYEE